MARRVSGDPQIGLGSLPVDGRVGDGEGECTLEQKDSSSQDSVKRRLRGHHGRGTGHVELYGSGVR